jgi:AraC-like DNA-binding protein
MLLTFLSLNLVLIHFQMVEMLSMATYIPFGLTLIVWYGPSYFFYTRRSFGVAKGHIHWHLIAVASGIWVITKSGLFSGWFLTAYFISVLLFYFFRSLQITLYHSPTKLDAWFKVCRSWFLLITLFFLTESVWMNIDLASEIAASNYMVVAFHVINLSFVMTSLAFLLRRPNLFSEINIIHSFKNRAMEVSLTELNLVVDYVSREGVLNDADLNRTKIMEETGISIHRISEIINSHFQKNFNEWLNDYRIDLAKKNLLHSNESVKEIYFSVGFNSKSAFNRAFKKRTGMTPSEYRESE